MSAENYGDKYWCVRVTKEISPSGYIMLHADRLKIDDNGVLTFLGHNSVREIFPVLILPPGCWLACSAASIWDGHPIAVCRWDEEISEHAE